MSRLVPVGTPFWKKPSGIDEEGTFDTMAVMPEESTAAHNVFCGVTVLDNEDADLDLHLQNSGVALARVQGPASVGDSLVQSAGNDFLVTQSAGSGAPRAGECRGDVPQNETYLVPMLIGGGGGGGSFPGIPEWADTGWNAGDLVVRSTGIKGLSSEGNAVDAGRQVGTWEARAAIPAGSDENGPSLDNTKWRQVAITSAEKIIYRKGTQRIVIDVGRDGDEDGFDGLPRVMIESHIDGTGSRIELPLSLCNGKRVYPQELVRCDGRKRIIICSDIYD